MSSPPFVELHRFPNVFLVGKEYKGVADICNEYQGLVCRMVTVFMFFITTLSFLKPLIHAGLFRIQR